MSALIVIGLMWLGAVLGIAAAAAIARREQS